MWRYSALCIVLSLIGWTGISHLKGFNNSLQTIDCEEFYTTLSSSFERVPDKKVFTRAVKGYNQLVKGHRIRRPILCIADFNMSANAKRLWVIDVHQQKVLFHSLVSHGKGSGQEYASEFSNKVGSHQSSLGFYVTAKTYNGAHGLSLYLDGLENGINSNARKRAVVIHGASYVSQAFIKKYGRLGRSHGCPALPLSTCKEIIQAIKGGSVLYIHADDDAYFETTEF